MGYIWFQGWNQWPDNGAAYASFCHPAGNRQKNNKLIAVDTEADYKVPYHCFTPTLDKPVPGWKTDYEWLMISAFIKDLYDNNMMAQTTTSSSLRLIMSCNTLHLITIWNKILLWQVNWRLNRLSLQVNWVVEATNAKWCIKTQCMMDYTFTQAVRVAIKLINS